MAYLSYMASTKRTDVHSPSNLVTEDYEYVASFDNQDGWAMSPWALEISRKLHTDQPERGAGQCSHCGAHIRYFAVLQHTPTGEYLAVGETCLDNRFSRATADFQRLRKQAELDRAQQRIRKLVAAFTEANPDLAFLATGELPESSARNGFLSDLSRKLNSYGELSPKQIEAARNSVVRDIQWASERAAKLAAEAVAPKSAVITGRIEISGEILSTKWIDSQFGSTLKMLVKDDRGFKVFGSVPSAINAERGARVVFVGTVEASKDDEHFGFFSRPTVKASRG